MISKELLKQYTTYDDFLDDEYNKDTIGLCLLYGYIRPYSYDVLFTTTNKTKEEFITLLQITWNIKIIKRIEKLHELKSNHKHITNVDEDLYEIRDLDYLMLKYNLYDICNNDITKISKNLYRICFEEHILCFSLDIILNALICELSKIAPHWNIDLDNRNNLINNYFESHNIKLKYFTIW